MTQTRPDSTAGTRQAGWIKPPLVDRPVGSRTQRPSVPAVRPRSRPRSARGDNAPARQDAAQAPPLALPSRIPGRTQETLRDSRPRWAVDARWHRPELTANEFPAISLLTVASSPPAAPAIPPQPPRASATRFPRARPRQGGRTGPWDLPIPGCRKQTPSYREPMGPHHPQALHQQ